MTNIEICQDVLTNGFAYVRESVVNVNPNERNYELKRNGSKPKGAFILDSFTAGAVMAVYNVMNEENKKNVLKLRITTLSEFAFKHVK